MEFEWDKAKARANARKHAVTFDEAITVFWDPRELMTYDLDHSITEDRFISVGMSRQGRLLVVGYTERENRIRIIFARQSTLTEMHDYEEA